MVAHHPGPYFFAWVDATETAFGHAHIRVDEEVFSFEIDHVEGDFPSLNITIRNPRVGLLAPGRKVWAWLSVNRDWRPANPEQVIESEEIESESESEAASVVPLFFGRLVGVPNDLDQELVQLSFIARPENLQAAKIAVANPLRVRPYWDPLWFSPATAADPDNILETRTALWHTDRTTLALTISDIISGEDGTINVGEDDVYHDSVHVHYGQAPARIVHLTATVSWTQNATGVVDVSHLATTGNPFSVLTYTGKGIVDGWPKPGHSLGGGWKVFEGSAVRVDGSLPPEWGHRGEGTILPGYQTFSRGNALGTSPDSHDVVVPGVGGHASFFDVGDGFFAADYQFPAHVLRVYRWQIEPTLSVVYDASRQRSEVLSFTLEADVQAIITEPGDAEVILLNMSSSELLSPIDAAGATPIQPSDSVYFSSARGVQSIEYLLAVARAQLLSRARAVYVDMEFSFYAAVDMNLSCRKNLALTDSRLPGGVAAGKIMNYRLSVDGDSGLQTCTVTIGCTVGHGDTVAPVVGNPTYVQTGYVDPGYQFYSGAFVMPIAGEVLYESIDGLPANDDGIDFSRMTADRVVSSVVITGDFATQEIAMGTEAADPNEVFTRLNAVPTVITINLNPVTGGPFLTAFPLNVSDLMVPKTIDLEASS